jgi:phosphoglycerate kinase
MITDDTRIEASLPTIRGILERGASVILMSHLGRPKGKVNPAMSLRPVAERLSSLLARDVRFANDCVGDEVRGVAEALQPGDVLLLENLRFHVEEEANDSAFARLLAELGDVYVNDAFGTAHRAHASTEGVTHFLSPCLAGLLMEKEIDYLGKALGKPERPYVAILGGAKISGKIDVISNLMDNVDVLLIGGGMTYTFVKSQGMEIGSSLVEEDKLELAGQLIEMAKAKSKQLILPVDTIVAKTFANDTEFRTVGINEIPVDMMGLDVGPETILRFKRHILEAKTIFWNGPMGVFEMPNFANGTIAVAEALVEATKKGCITVIGGGDSAAAINQMGLESQVSHVSTGGGASLELLEGKVLPGLAALTDRV